MERMHYLVVDVVEDSDGPFVPTPKGHDWSGWPGAFCLRCGIDDRREACQGAGHPEGCARPECSNPPCIEPAR